MSLDLSQFMDVDIQKIRLHATPFALLALHPAYKLDMELVERHYLILQKELHPDRFAHKSASESQTAQMMTSWINRAYTTLKDPVLRAEALLRIAGCSITDEKTAGDSDLLSEIMEWRQKLQLLESEPAYKEFCHELQHSIKTCEENFHQAWETRNQQTLQAHYLRLCYLIKTLKQAQQHTIKAAAVVGA